jgi:hypothetical protein
MILKTEWLLANYCEGCSPHPPVATVLRSNKPKNLNNLPMYDLLNVIHINAVIS